MKKLLMSLALLGTFAAMTAKGDSYMYWMVKEAEASTGPLSFTTAELYAVLDGQKVRAETDIPISTLAADSSGVSTARSGGVALGDYARDGWSFIVELYNGDAFVSQSSSPMTWAEVASAGAIYSPLNPGGAGTATFTSFNVPEPTSGLLMLFGLCGLALKRKRA